jgi:branched-chain amino acid transport system permease protein
VAIIIIGGMGSLAGSVVGAAVWLLLPAVITGLAAQASSTNTATDRILAESKPQLVNLAFGVLVIVLLIFAPEGIAGIGRNLRDRLAGRGR